MEQSGLSSYCLQCRLPKYEQMREQMTVVVKGWKRVNSSFLVLAGIYQLFKTEKFVVILYHVKKKKI